MILTNSGTGTFGVTGNVPLSAGAAPSGIVCADFNHDGKLDLAVSAKGTDDVQVALGNGDGTFAPAAAFALGSGFAATGLALADFNGDGDLDLVASGSANGDVAVLLGLGTGAFGPALVIVLSAGADLSAVLAVDVNGDGDFDLVATNRTAGTVSVLLGMGNGTFSPATSSAVGADVACIAAADFDRDGKLDVAGALQASGRVRLLLGHEDGTFAPATDFSAGGTGPVSIAVGDLDGNGSQDLVVANSTSDDVAILLGVAHTTPINLSLAGTVTVGATFQPSDVVRADFNGDGLLDLAVANRNHDSYSVALGAPGGTFSAAVETSIALGSAPVALVAADFDDDGDVDLAVLTLTTHAVVLLHGTGTGRFTGSGTVLLPPGTAPVALVAADFNRDGRLDLAVTNSLLGTVSLALGNGGMTFGAAVSYPLPVSFQGSAMTVTDLNDDGKLDLAVTGATTGDVAILLGDGLGAFAAATTANVAAGANLSGILATDVDRDGDVDLVTVNNTAGQVAVLLGNGDGTFGAPASTAVGADATAVVGGDFNRDGRVDLAVTLAGTGQVAILIGNGAGLFTPALTASDRGHGGRRPRHGRLERRRQARPGDRQSSRGQRGYRPRQLGELHTGLGGARRRPLLRAGAGAPPRAGRHVRGGRAGSTSRRLRSTITARRSSISRMTLTSTRLREVMSRTLHWITRRPRRGRPFRRSPPAGASSPSSRGSDSRRGGDTSACSRATAAWQCGASSAGQSSQSSLPATSSCP